MRESGFIGQNKEKWLEFEKVLSNEHKDAEKLSELFIHVTDDLSYARTFYPNRSVRVYLNNLAQRIFTNIYKSRKTRVNKFVNFWTTELPRAVYDARREFRVSFIIFMLAVSIGVLSSIYDPSFPRAILGDGYVDMTIQNIEKGDPMAVYKEHGAFDMFLGITLNNLRVAFVTFVLGVFLSVGTATILLYNGIMVGAFQYFFIERGYAVESLLTIWLHGTIEISCIIIAGAAGLVLGRGLVFPGTYSRLQAFLLSAKRGLKIMIGIAPLIVMAGFIESYLTRHTEAPAVVRGALIGVSLLMVLSYFVWYPWMLARKGFNGYVPEERIPPSFRQEITFTEVKNNGELFKETFLLYKDYIKPLFYTGFAAAVLYAAAAFLLHYFKGSEIHRLYIPFPGYVFRYFSHSGDWPLFALNTAFAAVVLFSSHFAVMKAVAKTEGKPLPLHLYLLKHGWASLLVSALLNSCFLIDNGFGVLLLIAIFAFSVLWHFVMLAENKSIFSALGRTFGLAGSMFGNIFGLFLVFAVVSMLYFLLLNSPILYLVTDFIRENFAGGENASLWLVWILQTILVYTALALVLPILFISNALQYFSLRETIEASHLKLKIANIGKSLKYGSAK